MRNTAQRVTAQVIPAKATRLTEIKSLQKHISDYSRTRDTFIKYRQAGYSKKFYEAHEGEIILHKVEKKCLKN